MMRLNLRRNPADYGETPGVGQTVGGRQIVNQLCLSELVMLRDLTRWAAIGCLHENHSALGAQIRRDAAWLDHVLGERARYMSGGEHG
jgi:hypothetical protein